MVRTRRAVEDFIFRGEKTGLTQVAFLTDIKLSSYQPRHYFDEAKLEELSQTVKEHGILEPLLVRQLPQQNQYELIAGGRRYRAAQRAGLIEVPIVVLELSEEQALEVAILENLQREDLNPIEETEGILNLLAMRLNLSVEKVPPLLHQIQKQVRGRAANNVIGSETIEKVQAIFNSLGLMEIDSLINNRLPLLNLPEDVLDSLRAGKLAYTKAKFLARVEDKQLRLRLIAEAIEQNLSLSQLKKRIEESQPQRKPTTLAEQMKDTWKRFQKAKLWDNPKKKKKVEKLIAQMEQLLTEK